MKKFIHWMYEKLLFIKDGMDVENNTYVKKKWLLSLLEFTYIVTIDRCIDSPGHRRIKKRVLMDLKRHT